MSYSVEYSEQARSDLLRLLDFLAAKDPGAAQDAAAAIRSSLTLLEQFPFSCRRAEGDDSTLREMVIAYGNSGYVALFKIRAADLVTILAIRHQLEDDYY